MTRNARSTRICRMVWVAIALLIGVGETGCEEVVEPDPDQEVHGVKPNANHLITGQAVGGADTRNSSVYELESMAGEEFLFRGLVKGNRAVGSLSTHGFITRQTRVDHDVRGICVCPESGAGPFGAVVAAGGQDLDIDGRYDVASLTAWSAEGTVMDRLVWASEEYEFWFNDLILVETTNEGNEFLAVGCGRNATLQAFPVIGSLLLKPDGTLERGALIPMMAVENTSFYETVRDPLEGGYFVLAEEFDAAGESQTLIMVRLNGDLTLDWSTRVVSSAWQRGEWGDGVATDGAFVYGTGWVETGRLDDYGNQWPSGVATSVSRSGQLAWARVIPSSQTGDNLSRCALQGGFLYACGIRDAFVRGEETKSVFGYGWLVRLDGATGTVLSNLTFGDEHFKNGFNTVIATTDRIVLGGYTAEKYQAGFSSWFAEVDPHRLDADPSVSPLGTREWGGVVSVEGERAHGPAAGERTGP